MVDLADLGTAVQGCQAMDQEVEKRRFEVGLRHETRCWAAPLCVSRAAPLCVSRTAPPVSLCLKVKPLKQTGPPESRGKTGAHSSFDVTIQKIEVAKI